MPDTRQQKRASKRQIKKDFFRGANADNVIDTLNGLTNAINNTIFNFYALMELLKDKIPSITEQEYLNKRKELLEKGGKNNAATN